ncbi:MAG: chromosome segregation protein SMC [Gammaproteobacteria bacterium]|nr:chromosome segregation protein SMC [Gammaproteobacteria bacterium]MBI5614738.1 chromosome segregation protein SMC [Gammaproteobacteria bacterium]
MRISKIKLAGFKSFVDPTTLSLPGNLTGIVGPNGCGKSNIIDALQWVMGESSAKQMRGDSMADVIFSGSTSRKPVGQASVELIFDNSDGTVGGQYAGFAELSIKRVVTRDGLSNYSLNGTRCRRRDVLDVFLGTGLGARGGYSVIEQGMISRVIEAKPEELRGFLEEAAGISKYKERRRETENRMRHTRENLDRLNDIREELEKQLSHLQRQAKAAEKYQECKTEERKLEAELLALRWREVDVATREQHTLIVDRENAVEQSIAGLRGVEAEQTNLREAQTQATDGFNRRQSEFYARSAEISRLEQALQHAEERRLSLEQQLERARRQSEEANALLAEDTRRQSEIADQIEATAPRLDTLAASEDEQGAVLRGVEAEAEAWQSAWDEFNNARAETARLEHAEQVRLQHLEAGISGARSRLAQLIGEQQRLDTAGVEQRIGTLHAELEETERQHDALTTEHNEVRSTLQQTRQDAQAAARGLHEHRSALQALTGRQASLKALQEAALGRDQRPLANWLQSAGFTSSALLAEQLQIDAGWERAVETALKAWLTALCGEQLVDPLLAADGRSLPAEYMRVVEKAPVRADAPGLADVPRLLDRVRGPVALESLLGAVYVADDLAAATALRARLAAHESVITRDGHWLGPNWAQLPGKAGAATGVLERERQLEELRQQVEDAQAGVATLQASLDAAQAEVQRLERRDQELSGALRATAGRVAETKSRLGRAEAELDQLRSRGEAIHREIQGLTQRSDTDESAVAQIKSSIEEMQEALRRHEARRNELSEARRDLQSRLDVARATWRDAREARHQLALQLEGLRSQQGALATALQRNENLRQELAARCTDLEKAMGEAVAPQGSLREQLDAALGLRVEAESALAAARSRLDDIDGQQRGCEENRSRIERELQERNRILEQARLEERALQVRMQELEERLRATGRPARDIAAELPAEAREEAWRERLESLATRITRLGPINLAAIDEFAQLQERKTYLDRQHADLTTALETLEDAIRKIDKETRTRFKETFDKVNAGFQARFPVLFGGGHAYLELTGEDLLETGVAVMARPPGKRNSTIHLLSGGEKALTALAFVFSLFELNPAPFCLLDEVDAPLDDANVVRLTEMLMTMAGTVQFLYVTHNKITMEIAEQLIGVTMHEPGVSRLVSVNMEEAVALAATA